MAHALSLLRNRFDRIGIVLSGLCALHCLATLFVVAALGLGGSVLLDPAIHRFGLMAAVLLGAGALGLGVTRHRRREPLLIGAAGLALMVMALVVGHGAREAVLTIAGVSLVALAHWRNLGHLGR